jgi:hypothetical protein
MTTVSSMALNERGRSLLLEGSVSEGLELFKEALSVLKNEIMHRSTEVYISDAPQKPLYQHEATAGTTGAFLDLLPASEVYMKEHKRFWIYALPLSIQRLRNGLRCDTWSNDLDAFTISFNVALASHLQGVEQEMGGYNDAARHSFMVAMKMYSLTLCQCQAIYKSSGVTISNTMNDHVYAAIFNNLVHVHAMLGERHQSMVYAEELLKTLFYLVDSGRVTTVREATTHKLLLENAHCLLMKSSNSAAAA